MITVELMGGLANRMRVIASAIWLKNYLGTTLKVIWNENYELNCPFNQLFDADPNFNIVSKSRAYSYLKASHQCKPLGNTINKFIGFDLCILEENTPTCVWDEVMAIPKSFGERNIFIKTCHEFGDNLPYYKHLQPIRDIKKAVDAISKKFCTSTIGVHIRRTDHAMAIENSPLELFVDVMKQKVHKDPDTKFFVCSDDKKTKGNIISVFGEGRIITSDKETSRATIDGLQNAVTELYALAVTKEIIGSYWSSFGEIASRLNNIPLTTINAGASG